MKVYDNSGAKVVQCIKTLKNSTTAKIGDVIVVAVKSVRSTAIKVKKGDVRRALVVNTKRAVKRADGAELLFNVNSVVLIAAITGKDKSLKPIATRIVGPVSRELKKKGYLKVIALSTGVF